LSRPKNTGAPSVISVKRFTGLRTGKRGRHE
jgi:hypothetical protein